MKAPLLTLIFTCLPLLALALLFPACSRAVETAAISNPAPPVPPSAQAPQRIRQPAVAGLFYPKDAGDLTRAVDQCLAAASSAKTDGVRALISPHAGYEYSGRVAAEAYHQLAGGSYHTVIILAASHYALFRGASVPATDAYQTPLGLVPIAAQARELARQAPFVLEPRCLVRRPPWSALSSRPPPPAGEETPETWEHSVEVQLPFLQRLLKQFTILPVIFGQADPEKVANALAPLVDDKTLVVVSTDLSHYRSCDEARLLDTETVRWIQQMNIDALKAPAAEERACGQLPVLTLLHLAKLKGWTAQALDYRNSGDTGGDKSRVVGYSAVVFVTPNSQAPSADATPAAADTELSAADRQFLLDLARRTIREVTAGRDLPQLAPGNAPEACRAEKGCFVTLTKAGDLRGCIGNIVPTGPLFRSVIQNARSAALRDPRFQAVSASETDQLEIEISVLTEPRPLVFSSPDDLLAKIQPNRDGVVLRIGEHSATFLPQVWEQLPDKTEFLSRLAAKSGCAPSAWRGRDVSVLTYRVEAFEEQR